MLLFKLQMLHNPIFFLPILLQLELFLSAGTVCLSIYSLVAGIFGMNIPYTWNEGHEYVFKWVCWDLLYVFINLYHTGVNTPHV